jgi:hypothetical protein
MKYNKFGNYMSRNSGIVIVILMSLAPGIANASGTKSDYVILGWIMSVLTFSVYSIFWWLFTKCRGFNQNCIVLFVLSVVFISPLGIIMFSNGAVLPNWFILYGGDDVPVEGYISNFIILVIDTIIFFRTRKPTKGEYTGSDLSDI